MSTKNTPGRPMSTPLQGKLPKTKKDDPLPYCERHATHYIRTCGYCYSEAQAAARADTQMVGSVMVVPTKVGDLLCRSSCNACVRSPSAMELRFGHPDRASSILCVSLCNGCAAGLQALLSVHVKE